MQHTSGPEDSAHLAERPFPGPGSRPSSQGSSPGVSCRPQKPPQASPASAAALLHRHTDTHTNAYYAFLVWKFVIFNECIMVGVFVLNYLVQDSQFNTSLVGYAMWPKQLQSKQSLYVYYSHAWNKNSSEKFEWVLPEKFLAMKQLLSISCSSIITALTAFLEKTHSTLPATGLPWYSCTNPV